MFYPRESRKIRYPDKPLPPPDYLVGSEVRLKGKPGRVRKILKAEWHMHRYRYCYTIETQTSDSGRYCPAYWFVEQLIPVEESDQRSSQTG